MPSNLLLVATVGTALAFGVACGSRYGEATAEIDEVGPAPSVATPPDKTSDVTPTTPAPPVSVVCTTSFALDVMPVMQGCTSGSGCHSRNQSMPLIDLADLDGTYASMTSYKVGTRMYVDTATRDPEASGLICNLEGVAGCGAKMPVGGAAPSHRDLALIRSWLACGAPKN